MQFLISVIIFVKNKKFLSINIHSPMSYKRYINPTPNEISIVSSCCFPNDRLIPGTNTTDKQYERSERDFQQISECGFNCACYGFHPVDVSLNSKNTRIEDPITVVTRYFFWLAQYKINLKLILSSLYNKYGGINWAKRSVPKRQCIHII